MIEKRFVSVPSEEMRRPVREDPVDVHGEQADPRPRARGMIFRLFTTSTRDPLDHLSLEGRNAASSSARTAPAGRGRRSAAAAP
jgi:hypothetical protein